MQSYANAVIPPGNGPDDLLGQRPGSLSKARLQELQTFIARQRSAGASRSADPDSCGADPAHGGPAAAPANVFVSAPWWQRIVLDPAFRRAITNLSSRRLKSFEESYSHAAPAQAVVIAPHVWEPFQSQKLSSPASGAHHEDLAAAAAAADSKGGMSYRWTTAFPPTGYTFVPSKVASKPRSEGPIFVNIYTTCEAHRYTTIRELLQSKELLAPGADIPQEVFQLAGNGDAVPSPSTVALDLSRPGSSSYRTDLMEQITLDAQRVSRQVSAAKQRHDEQSRKAGTYTPRRGDGKGGKKSAGLEMPPPRCYHFVGTIRPSMRLIRFRILCMALAEYAEANRSRPQELADPAALLYGLPPIRSLLYQEESHRPAVASLPSHTAPVVTLDAVHTGDFARVDKVTSMLPAVVPWKLVEDVTAHSAVAPPVQKVSQLVYIFPASSRFTGLDNPQFGATRLEFLRTSPVCIGSLRRLYATLKKDLTGRVPKAEWVRFVLDLMNLYFPSYMTQSNIELAEDEWLCRGSIEKPDFTMFADFFFDFPLTLMHWVGMGHMSEIQYVQFWDFTLLAIAGAEAYENTRNRSSSFAFVGAAAGGSGSEQQQRPMSPGSPRSRTFNTSTATKDGGRQAGGVVSLGEQAQSITFNAPDSATGTFDGPTAKAKPIAAQQADDAGRPHLPDFLVRHCLEVPLIRSSDDYRRHALTQEVLQDQSILAKESFRQPLLAFRKVEGLLSHEQREERQVAAAAAAAMLSGNLDQSMKDGGGFTTHSPKQLTLDDFPSTNMQRKLRGESSAATGKLQGMSDKERQEAIRIQTMLAIENRSSAFALYETTFRVEPLERDDLDDILSFCSEFSDQVFDNPRESVRSRYMERMQLQEELRRDAVSRGNSKVQKAGKKVGTISCLARKASTSRPTAPQTVTADPADREEAEPPEITPTARQLSKRKSTMARADAAAASKEQLDDALLDEKAAEWAAVIRQGERERVLNLRTVKGGLELVAGDSRAAPGLRRPTSPAGYAPFQMLERQARVNATAQGGLASGAELTTASMHAAVQIRPFAGVNGALRRRVQQLPLASGDDQQVKLQPPAPLATAPAPGPLRYQPQQQQQQQRPATHTSSRPTTTTSTPTASTPTDPYDFRHKALRDVAVDYSGTGKTAVPVHLALQRLRAGNVGSVPPPPPASTFFPTVHLPTATAGAAGGGDNAVSDGGGPLSYRSIGIEALADAITVTGSSNGCTLATTPAVDRLSMPSFLARGNRERIMPPTYTTVGPTATATLPPSGPLQDPVLEPSTAPTSAAAMPPQRTGSAKSGDRVPLRPNTRGPQLLPRSEWAKVVVAPIRPPRYQVPQLPQRPPSDDVVVNGRVLPKPHRTLQIVRAIQLEAAGAYAPTGPAPPTVVKQHI